MKPKLLLRIASVIILLHAVGHFLGVANVTTGETDEENQVIHSMTDHRFLVMGRMHSFADFLTGFGWVGEVMLIFIAYLLWLNGSLAVSQPGISRKISLAIFVTLLANVVLEYIYFFPIAYGLTTVATILTGLAFLRTRVTQNT